MLKLFLIGFYLVPGCQWCIVFMTNIHNQLVLAHYENLVFLVLLSTNAESCCIGGTHCTQDLWFANNANPTLSAKPNHLKVLPLGYEFSFNILKKWLENIQIKINNISKLNICIVSVRKSYIHLLDHLRILWAGTDKSQIHLIVVSSFESSESRFPFEYGRSSDYIFWIKFCSGPWFDVVY